MGENPNNNNNKASSLTFNKDSKHIHEKAFYRGYRDFLHNRLDSPYPNDSLLSKEWQRGQNAAYFVNLRKFNSGSLIKEYYNKKKKNKTRALHKDQKAGQQTIAI